MGSVVVVSTTVYCAGVYQGVIEDNMMGQVEFMHWACKRYAAVFKGMHHV